MISEAITSQMPMMYEYLEGARVYWQNSRHPQNVSDIMGAARESVEDFTLRDKAILAGATALELFQLSPGNEVLLTTVGGNVLHETGNVLPASLAVGATTGTLELAIGLGVAYGLDKFRPAVQVLGERYVKKPEENQDEATTKQKVGSAASLYGVAFLGGAAGATIYRDLKEQGKPLKENAKTAAAAAGLLAVSNTLIATVLTGTARITEAAGVDNATDTFANAIRNPLVPATVVGLAFAGVKLKEYRNVRQTVAPETVIAPDQDKRTGFLRRLLKRTAPKPTPVTVVESPQLNKVPVSATVEAN